MNRRHLLTSLAGLAASGLADREIVAYKIRAVLLHQPEQFFVETEAVLDAVGAAEDGIPRGVAAVGVSRQRDARAMRLGDSRLDLLRAQK